MACANVFVTILALLTFAFVVWPNWGGDTATNWVVGLSMLFIILSVWGGMKCRCTDMCETKPAPTPVMTTAPKRKAVKRKPTKKKTTKKRKKR